MIGTTATLSNKIRITCIGDSLTEGYLTMFSHEFHPYSKNLRTNLLQAKKPFDYQIINLGISGEVISEIFQRLKEHMNFLEKSRDSVSKDFIVFLGGTNNLGSNSAETITKELFEVYDFTKNIAKTTKKDDYHFMFVGMTIPEANLPQDQYADYHIRRGEINKNIKEYFQKEIENQSMFYLLDLCSEIPSHSLSDDSQSLQKYWSDNLHFSKEGYDQLGSLVAQIILDLL